MATNFRGTTAWLARVVGAMQRAPATTSTRARLRRQFMVDAQQQRCKLLVFNKGMAHWQGLGSWSNGDSLTAVRVITVAERDLLHTITLLDQIGRNRHQVSWPCSCGLVKLCTVAVDGTKLRANASRHKAMSYERMLKVDAELKAQIDGLLNRAKAADDLEKNEPDIHISSEIKRRADRLSAITAAKLRVEQRQ